MSDPLLKATLKSESIYTRQVFIGIPSYRRPGSLNGLLTSISSQNVDAAVSVVVAENDLDNRQAVSLIDQLAGTYRFPLNSVLSVERGISSARNALVVAFLESNAKMLVMLDDDQWIEPDWLAQILATQERTEADVVGSRVLPDFLGAETSSIQLHQVYWRPHRPTGIVNLIYGAGGVLIMRRAIEQITAPWFDPVFSFLGGEDKDFFIRLKLAGGHFATCAEARTHEIIPIDRQTKEWARQRMERIGMTDTLIDCKYASGLGFWIVLSARIAGGFFKALTLLVLNSMHPVKREAAIGGLLRTKGKILALVGKRMQVYR